MNTSNGAFSFHTPQANEDAYATDDSYQTIDEEDDDDDEYEPISLSGWGDNAVKEEVESPSWDTLIDSNIKVKAGGVGSGNLHRRGGNFKPVSEDLILAQRLNKPIPGKKLPGSSKSRGGKKKKKTPGAAAGAAGARPPFPPTRFSRPFPKVTPHVPPPRQPSANAPPSPWGTIALAEIPFWEKKTTPVTVAPAVVHPLPVAPAPVNAYATLPPPSRKIAPMSGRKAAPVPSRAARPTSPIPVLCETPFWEVKKDPVPTTPTPPPLAAVSTAPVVVAAPATVPKIPREPVFNPNVPSFDPVLKSPVKTTRIEFNPTVPSFNPTTSISTSAVSTSSGGSSSVKTNFNPNVHEFTPLPFVTMPVKTPVKITQPHDMVSDEMRKLSMMENQTGPESTRGLEEPQALLQMTLALAPGISTEILVYENSDPHQIAEDFARKHVLNVTNRAKSSLANTIRLLIETKLNANQLL
ncbi:hypothetical protein INT47_006262 [Mucor saturninus]|uniref:Uncharacterized protein n=1 Tax=Mucor saturninus TaxID=64648 RepID=A0A8H7V002_9FUNG|nr:hypothetical protein INT47_006262 [Mucor saturninus]